MAEAVFQLNTAQNPVWGRLTIPDGGKFNVVFATAAYSAAAGDFVCANPTAGAFSVKLPAAASCPGQGVIVYNQSNSANAVSTVAAGGETITGDSGSVPLQARSALYLLSDGISDWAIVP